MQGGFNICKTINVIHYINKTKGPSHINTSMGAKKFLTNSTSSYDKNPQQSEYIRNLPQ